MAEFIRLSSEKAVNPDHISRVHLRNHDPLTVDFFMNNGSLFTVRGEEAENLIDAVNRLVINRIGVDSEMEAIIDD